jgi:hypothetical protein
MRVPSWDRFSHYTQIIGVFICGIIVGFALFTAFEHNQINRLLEERSQLHIQNEELREEAQLSQTYKGKQIIRKISVKMEQSTSSKDINPITEEAIKKALEGDLAVFKGLSIYKIDTSAKMARLLLDDKRYTVDDNDYIIEIKTMLLVDKVLHVWISVKKY